MAWFLTEPLLLLAHPNQISMKTTSILLNKSALYLRLAILATVLCLFSCKKDDVPSNKEVKGESKVKLINASNNPASVDFYLDDSKISAKALAPGEVSDYVKVESGAKNATVTVNGVTDADAEVNFVPTLSYTSFYVEDKSGKGEVLTFEDDLGATEVGKARIRIINLSPYFSNMINLNITGGTLLVNSLAFKQASGYFLIDPSLSLNVSILGSSANKTIPTGEFEAGKIYTIWLSGNSNASLKINKVIYN